MPNVGDVAVADRGVPTGAIGSHVGFVTDVDLKNGTFTLESGNSSNIYTTRKISCFSFHTPPKNVLSALTGPAIGNALTGLLLSRASVGAYQFVPAISSPDPDDCSQGSLDTDNYDEIQNNSLQHVQAPQLASTSSGLASFIRYHLMRRDFARIRASFTHVLIASSQKGEASPTPLRDPIEK